MSYMAKPRPEKEAGPPQRPAALRPGLPVSLLPDSHRQAAPAEPNAGAAERAATGSELSKTTPDNAAAGAAIAGQEGVVQADAPSGTAAVETAQTESGGAQGPQGAGSGEAAGATVSDAPAASGPPAFRVSQGPVLPPFAQPDMNAVITPLAPPPPLSAVKKRDKILKSTGLTPESHHAAVQQALNRTADAARSAQRAMVFEVSNIAAHTKAAVEALAGRVPAHVAGGEAVIRQAAAQARAAITSHARAEIRRVAAHVEGVRNDLQGEQASADVRMHQMLMQDAPQVLRDAKAAMDAQLSAHADAAAAKIAEIPSGARPAPLGNGVAAAKETPASEPAKAEASITPVTFAAAQAAISGKLMQDQPGNRMAQYGNLQCNAALAGLVTAQSAAYAAANAETRANLASEENKARFFDSTMQLILPTEHDEKTDDHAYTGNLEQNMSLQYMHLSRAKQRVIRQIDEKLTYVLTKQLNPDHKDSLPFQSIKGLREAGEQISKGLMDQAAMLGASLKANLAALARTYPDLVKRLQPLVESGEFLEASSLLARLAEAEASITGLRDGQIASVAGQAAQALARARASFNQQISGLQKAAGKGASAIHETIAVAQYDFSRTAMAYTGLMDDGVRSVLPQLRRHLSDLAERLLGPKTSKDQHFSNIETAAINYLNGVIASEWGGYSARVNGLEKTLGGVQTGPEGLASSAAAETNGGTPFRQIRDGARTDMLARANAVINALPERMDTTDLVIGYISSPIATGILHYMSDPDENAVVTALATPWPGPLATEERYCEQEGKSGPALQSLIRERMDEDEKGPVLALFSTSASERSAGKQTLINNSSSTFAHWGGINDEATQALSRSLTADEISQEAMSSAQRATLAENLRRSLSGPDAEIAAAYVNGEPDLALALRLRSLFDQARGKSEAEKMQIGAEMDRIIQAELSFGAAAGYMPTPQADAARDAAFLRFDEVTRNGRSEVSVRTSGPAPRAAGAPLLSASQSAQPPAAATQSTLADAPVLASRPPPLVSRQPPPAAPPAPVAQQPVPDPEEQTRRAANLEAARRVVIDYMNRPAVSRISPIASDPVSAVTQMAVFGLYSEFAPLIDGRDRSYNPLTGRYTIATEDSVMAYNAALITHGANSPEARALAAAATYNRVSDSWFSLSTTETNQLNEAFTDHEYAALSQSWQNATPSQREAMRPQWLEAQKKHDRFLRLTAQGMGMGDGLDDPVQVRQFVQNRLGGQFAREGEQYRVIGAQITGNGRINIDTGMQLASGGEWDGTNEELIKNVLGNRSHAELNQRSSTGETMGNLARRLANRELDGDDWQAADIALMGTPENDLDRADIAQRRYQHQRQDGTGWITRYTMPDQSETRWLENSRNNVDSRVLAAAQAGLEERKRRGGDISGLVLPANPRLPDGSWNPLVRQFAMDGDGNLRGNGPLMSSLANDVEQTAGFYKAEIDRQESFLTNAITILAIIVSVALLFIPGVNLVAAGVLVALLSGAATIAVKAGMRGGRYGFEEMATDMAMTAIEAATAGIGGKMSQGIKAAQMGAQTAKLGRIARIGAALEARFGPKLAPVAQEAITGAMSGAATSALDDHLWDDGLGRGFARVAGQGLKGGMAAGANAAVSGALTRGLHARLSPDAADGAKLARLNRAGQRLGPGGREMLTELVSNVGGALSSESVSILADIAADRHAGGLEGALERLGKAGVRELFSAAGRTKAQQAQRLYFRKMAGGILAHGRSPTSGEARLLRRIGIAGGLVDAHVGTEDFTAQFSKAQARMADMPPALRQAMAGMDPANTLKIIALMDAPGAGDPAAHRALFHELAKDHPGVDADEFGAIFAKAHDDHAPQRDARADAMKAAAKALLGEVSGPERGALRGLNAGELIGAEPALLARAAKAVSQDSGEFELRSLAAEMAPGQPDRAKRIFAQLHEAANGVREARLEVAKGRARVRDDLLDAAPPSLREAVGRLSHRDLSALKMSLEGESGLSRAAAILKRADPKLTRSAARALARQMAGRALRQGARMAHLDNVPDAHRSVMSQLGDDALMEIRVAQFTRKRLSPERIEAIIAQAAEARPGLDAKALRLSLKATLSHPHGRPGFREAFAQKRALLDMIPFGMKRIVLRTPILTLPESAFLSHVRGKGNENAVMILVNGQPVILLKAGASVRALAEEGLHVLQYHDPQTRGKIALLGEARMANWDDLPLGEQIAAYRAKMEVEADGQRRLIAKLERRAEGAFWPGAREQARLELELARHTLGELEARHGRPDALALADLMKMAADPALRPGWLKQPARLFSKVTSDAEHVRGVLPGLDAALETEVLKVVGRMKNRKDKIALLEDLRVMVGSMPPEVLAANLARLAGVQDKHLVKSIRTEIGMLGEERAGVRKGLADNFVKFLTDGNPGATEAAKALLVSNALTADNKSEPLELRLAKTALLRRLANRPSGAKRADIWPLVNFAADLLTSPQFAGKPLILAAALEGMTVWKAFHTALAATETALRDGLQKVLSAGDDFNNTQRDSVYYLVKSFYEGKSSIFIENFSEMISKISKHNQSGNLIEISPLMKFMRSIPADKISSAFSGLAGIVEASSKISAASGGKIRALSHSDLLTYLKRAVNDPDFMRSFLLLSNRANNGTFKKPDLIALQNLEMLELDERRDFLLRHADPLTESDPLLGSAEVMAHSLVTMSKSHVSGVELTIQEARSIAKRMGVLEHVVLFNGFSANAKTRQQLMNDFLAIIGKRVKPIPAAGLSESAAEARGLLIEGEFRGFVRDSAAETAKLLPADLAKLSPDAARAVMELFFTGDVVRQTGNGGLTSELPGSVAAEVFKAVRDIAAKYSNGNPAKEIIHRILKGILNTEVSAKGEMMEEMVRMITGHKDHSAMPALIRSLLEGLTDETVKRFDKTAAFLSIDQAESNPGQTKNLRSLDHVMRVDTAAAKALGIEHLAGKKLGADSKNGESAFKAEQFKRYVVEMLKSLSPDKAIADASIFGSGKLEGLLYISNNAENMKRTIEAADRLLTAMLAGSGNITITVETDGVNKPYDVTDKFKVTRAIVAANLARLNILFTRIGHKGPLVSANLHAAGFSGPLVSGGGPVSIQEMLRRLLAHKQPP